jgi:hypothetical protein
MSVVDIVRGARPDAVDADRPQRYAPQQGFLDGERHRRGTVLGTVDADEYRSTRNPCPADIGVVPYHKNRVVRVGDRTVVQPLAEQAVVPAEMLGGYDDKRRVARLLHKGVDEIAPGRVRDHVKFGPGVADALHSPVGSLPAVVGRAPADGRHLTEHRWMRTGKNQPQRQVPPSCFDGGHVGGSHGVR